MSGIASLNIVAVWPVRLEYFSGWAAAGLFALLAAPVVLLGMRSLNGLGPVRKWVAIGVRLAVLLVTILILGGMRWQREHKDLEVIVVRDISQSTSLVQDYPGYPEKTLQKSIDDFLMAASDAKHKPPNDRIGQVSVARDTLIDAMPSARLELDTAAIRDGGTGTDLGSGIQLALAAMGKDAMRRLVLITDANPTMGDLDAALNAATSMHVPIDVLPLRYNVLHEVMLDRVVTPTIRRENEDFSIDVVMQSTNVGPVTARLTVYHQNQPMDLDPYTAGVQGTKLLRLTPGINVERVKVAGQKAAGAHQFRAVVEAENVSASVSGAAGGAGGGMAQGDTLASNNQAEGFTFVRGKGQVLYLSNVPDDPEEPLRKALTEEGITLDEARTRIDQFPTDLITLQNYDAVILENAQRGPDGLSEEQQKMLASYVHDSGGGLIMIGGTDAFGAGGWQGSKLEEVLPVDMDIPAQRQIAKGALVMIMHACEFPDGNYWGAQCAIKAAQALSDRDEVGVISYNWKGMGGGMGGGSQWDYPLQPRGNGNGVTAAIKRMQIGDMPDFESSVGLALNGSPGNPGLLASDARQKHIIIISDGDPSAASSALIQKCIDNKITISTVQVYPHAGVDNLKPMAEKTKGKAYGPINANPNQLPQIFIKEATVVRRSLIYEDLKVGIPVHSVPNLSDVLKGVQVPGLVNGMVLTSLKKMPTVENPLVAGPNNDPLLAIWQAGLGKAAVFTSDAHRRWNFRWIGMNSYATFWAQLVRAVSRAAQSGDIDVSTTITGDTGKVLVEALNKDSSYANFLSITGKVLGPDMVPHDVRLNQTGPGTYEAKFSTPMPGNYVMVLSYRTPDGKTGVVVTGAAMSSSPELRELKSNDALMAEIARRTGGRVLDDPFNADRAGMFRRDGLKRTASPLPVWDVLIPWLLGLILVDVATRRIAWDWQAIKRAAGAVAEMVRGYTLSGKVETRQTVDALKRVKTEVAEKARADEGATGASAAVAAPPPDPKAKFQADGVEGDITKVVGGATDKPIPSAPRKVEPKGVGGAGGHTGSLLEAKRRAQQQIREKEKGEGR